jgi:hypothetical protein
MDGSERPRKVAVGTIVRFAYRTVFGRLGVILDLGWIMLLALLAAQILPDLLVPGRHASAELEFDVIDVGQAVVTLLSASAFAVRWHQSILVGDPHRQPVAAFFRAWARFLIYGCIVYALIGAIVGVAAVTMSRMANSTATMALVALAAVIVGFAVTLLTVRCSLVFPAAACGQPLGVGAAWRQLRGNTWRLIFSTILATLPVTVVTSVFTAILLSTLALATPGADLMAQRPLGFTILTGLIASIADMLVVALSASLLAGFYRELVAWRGPAANAEFQR